MAIASLISTGRAAAVLVALQALAASQTDEEVAWLPKVEISTLSEDVRAELREAEDAARASPNDPEIVGELGRMYFGYKFNNAAAACFVRAASVDENPFRWWYYTGLSHKRASRSDAAIEALAKALELKDYAPASVELATLLIDFERPRAIALLEGAIVLEPKLASAHAGLGRCATMDGKDAEAIEHFRRALEIAPTYGTAHYELAMLLRSTGAMEEAANHLRAYGANRDSYTARDPLKRKLRRTMRASSVMTRRVRTMWERGRLNEALEALQGHYLEVNPNEEAVRNLIGHTYMRLEQYDKAVEQFELILVDHPGYVDTRSSLATALQMVGRRDDAERVLRESLAQHPDSGLVLHHLALVLAQAREDEEALRLFARAVVAQPANADYRSNYGRALAGADRHDEAIENIRVALQLGGKTADNYEQLGNALASTGDAEHAKEAWAAAISIEPTRQDSILALGSAHMASRHFSEAEEVLDQGVRALPKSHALAGRLAWLLATCADESRVDGQRAVALAETACKLTNYTNPKYLDILAASFARALRYEDAVRTAKRAIVLATKKGRTGLAKAYERRCTLYSAGNPFTQP